MRWFRSAGLLCAAGFSIVLAGCGDDSTEPGPTDTSPPTITAVTPVDLNHIQVTFSEGVKESSAEEPTNYRIVEGTPAPAGPESPGDEIPVAAAVLHPDGKTVMLSTNTPMQNLPYDLFASNIEDLAGNRTTGESSSPFPGSNDPDVTAPTILSHTPAANATNVPLAQQVVIEFSETMDFASVTAAFTWTGPGGAVGWEAQSEHGTSFVFQPHAPLARNTNYTVTLAGTAHDWAGNTASGATWSFRTSNEVDTTPPTVVSSSPANGATHVALASNLSITFSEAVVPSLEEVLVTPDFGEGALEWSPDGRTFTFDPAVDLLADTQYTILIPPGAVQDLAGNGNATLVTIVFTTGTALASGSIAGTLSGDPNSAAAANPAGAIVIASDVPPFSQVDLGVVSATLAGTGGSFTVGHLPDRTYWPVAIKDANDDGRIDPERGDAIGIYGIDFASQSGEPDSVIIAGGSHATGVDFALFDPVAMAGSVVYEGTAYPGCCYSYYVGIFDSAGFDPNDPLASQPLYSTEGGIPYETEWTINQFDQGLEPGSYYVGAFMDANFNGTPDAGDPLALYVSNGAPVLVTLGHGTDVHGITIHLTDPVAGRALVRPAAWPAAKAVTPLQQAFHHAVALVQRTLEARQSSLQP